MAGIFPSRCAGYKRDYITKRKLPINHRMINKTEYLNRTLNQAWRYHLYAHNLQVEDVIFRKITYDAIYDALRNSNDKIHYKDFLDEYAKFQKYWDENFSELNEKIIDWENYRQSGKYQYFIEQLKHIKRFDRRLQASIDNALAFMYAKYQKGFVLGETLTSIEQRLRLDVIQKAWSKKWLWVAASLLYFDANDLYAQTLGNSQIAIREWDKELQEAIKIKVNPWYERKDLALSTYEKTMFKIYENVIIPVAGELGSVALAEAARRGTVIALLHITRMLTNFAKFHPKLKVLSWGAQLAGNLAHILNNSVLAWLGWQIGIEWSLDATIQAFMSEAIKHIYYGLTKAPIWKARNYTDWGLFELAAYYQYKKYVNGKISSDEEDLINFVYQYGSEKQKEILNRIAKSLETAQRLYNFRRFFYQTEKEFQEQTKNLLEKAIYDPDNFFWESQKIFTEDYLKAIAKLKIDMLQGLKGEQGIDLDIINVSRDVRNEKFKDKYGYNIDKTQVSVDSSIFVPLDKCYVSQKEISCYDAYVEGFSYFAVFERGEKTEYIVRDLETSQEEVSDLSQSFFSFLSEKSINVLEGKYGIDSIIRNPEFLKLPILFVNDTLRLRITKKCVSVVAQRRGWQKTLLDYMTKYVGKRLIFKHISFRNYRDMYDYGTWRGPAGLYLPTNYIYIPELTTHLDYSKTYTTIRDARFHWQGHYYSEEDPSIEMYIDTFSTYLTYYTYVLLSFTFVENAIIIERWYKKEWVPGQLFYSAIENEYLINAKYDRWVVNVVWDGNSRTNKRKSKRSKLICISK